VKSDKLAEFIKQSTADATIANDGFKAYRASEAERSTLTIKLDTINNPDYMMWLHPAISNVKAFLLGTYRCVFRRMWHKREEPLDVPR